MKSKIDYLVEKVILVYYAYKDAILGVFLTLASGILFVKSFSISIIKEPVSTVDTARFFPQLVFGAQIPIGIVLFIRGMFESKRLRATAPEEGVLAAQVIAFKRSVIALLAILVYILLIEPLGFIPAAIIYLLFSMFYMSERAGWKPVQFLIVSVVVTVSCYFLFRRFVYVRLPSGILKGVLG